MICPRILAAFAAAGLAGAHPALAQQALPRLDAAFVAGTWTVSRLVNDPSMTITALVDDDPAYMGAEVTFSADAIAWATTATNGQGTFDDCANPRFDAEDDPGEYEVDCDGDDDWGPESDLTVIDQNTMTVDWYDGGILTLTRN